MLDALFMRLLPALLFGSAIGGLLWLLGLMRKRGALATMVVLGTAYLAGEWPVSVLLAAQLATVAAGGWVLGAGHRLRMGEVITLTAAALAAAWAGFLDGPATHWQVAVAGGAAGAALAWTARAATARFSGTRLRLGRLRATSAGGFHGAGLATGIAVAVVVIGVGWRTGFMAAGAPGLVLTACVAATACADALRRDRAGLVVTSGVAGAVLSGLLTALLP